MFDSLKVHSQETNSTSLTELFEYQQYLKGTMYNELGLNANYNMKRERLTAGEVNMNIDSLYPLIYDMYENRKQALEKINELFGTKITVEFNHIWKQKQNEVELMGVDLEEQARMEQEREDKVDTILAELNESIAELTREVDELDIEAMFEELKLEIVDDEHLTDSDESNDEDVEEEEDDTL